MKCPKCGRKLVSEEDNYYGGTIYYCPKHCDESKLEGEKPDKFEPANLITGAYRMRKKEAEKPMPDDMLNEASE